MSRYWVISIIMILIIVISCLNLFILYKTKNDTINLINCIIEDIDNSEIQKANDKKSELFTKWHNDKKFLSLFIKQNILDEVSTQIGSLYEIEEQSFKGQLYIIKIIINDIFDDELPLLRNIL